MTRKHISPRQFVVWCFTMLWLIFVSFLMKVGIHAVAPDRLRIDYSWWVYLVAEQHVRGTKMRRDSEPDWRNVVDVQRQDTPYWRDANWLLITGQTQYRPIGEATRRITPWSVEDSTWEYSLGVPVYAVAVKMCWAIKGKTKLWYPKTGDYCTDWYNIVEPWQEG